MAQEQKNISVTAPGFLGINTENAPLDLGLEWAKRARNAVIDDSGRIASRKGFSNRTDGVSAQAGGNLQSMKEFRSPDGSTHLYSGGNNALFYGYDDITAMTPVAPINGDNWQIIPFKGYCLFVQAGNQPVLTTAAAPTTLVDAMTSTIPNVPVGDNPSCGTAGEGHVWVGGYGTDQSVVAWSANILDASWVTGEQWTGGDSGQLDLSLYWPQGYDSVEAMIVHNGFLYILGRVSILIFSGAYDPTNALKLEDSVNGIGCISRDSLVPLGRDLFFLDANGVRSMSRVIQEKSAPIGDISANVHTDLELTISNEPDLALVKAEYSPEEHLYVLIFPNQEFAVAFDTRVPLENGSRKVTSWHNLRYKCMERTVGAEFLFGNEGIALYTGSVDINISGEVSPIAFLYETHPQDFDQPVTSKFPKQVDVTLIGGQGQCLNLLWGYDYKEPTDPNILTNCFADVTLSEYNIAEYNVGEYNSYNFFIIDTRYNVWGSGRNISFQLNMDVSKYPIAIQELNIQALTGRIL